MKQSLKERWAEISALIEKNRDLLDEIRKSIRSIERNPDYRPWHEEMVDEWLEAHPDYSYPIYTDEDKMEWWEAIYLIDDCITDYRFDKYGHYFSDDTPEELESGEAEGRFAEVISYSTQIQALRASHTHTSNHLETLEAEREALIKPFQALYENALDDNYYGYGYNTWYNGTKDVEGAKEYFDSEDDAKFLWRLAFYMAAEGSWDNALDD